MQIKLALCWLSSAC